MTTPGDFLPWPADLASRYRRAGYWQGKPLCYLLERSAARWPDRTALISGEWRCTYRQLQARAVELAGGLHAQGIGPGDRVVVQLPNIPQLVETLLALFRLGAVPVLALPAHRAHELRHFVQQADASTYITADTFGGFDYRKLARELQQTAGVRTVLVAGEGEEFPSLDTLCNKAALPSPPAADNLALLQLSGGTTSVPKLIPRTHDDYFYSVRASADICRLSTESVYLAVLPAVHNFPLSSPGWLGTLWAGGTLVLADSGAPEIAFDLIEKHGVTITALVPPLALTWLRAVPQQAHRLASLQLTQVGGAKLSVEAARQMMAAFPGKLQQVFGMAEGLVNYTRLDDPDEIIAGTQGRPISPADEVRVVDDEDRDLPPGETGHLLTRGPYTIRSYYRAPEHQARSFTAEGFYRTGDLVRLTEPGYLIVEGRSKDQINRGGEKVSAEEVENQILAHPAVHDVAVVAMPDPYLGERNCAFVILNAGQEQRLRLPELRRFLRDRGLAEYKLPDRLEILPQFPQTSVGKVSKKALRERVAQTLTPAHTG